ncbi:MAG: ammonium transporter [Methylacidiphilales bacterium]|nr:ammonium transporter [Candidatus Methylacidiphilales bacterium]
MIKRLSPILRWTVCGLVLTLGAIQVKAQATTAPASTAAAPAAAAPAAPAAPPAPTLTSLNTSVNTLNTEVADLAAYVTNGQAGNELATTTEGNNDSILKSGLNPQPVAAGKEPAYPNMVPGPGHNAWMLTSTALVLMMTLPGLALFYGGMVRRKNVLSVLAQCFAITGLVTILWWLCGYGLVFGVNHGWATYDPKAGSYTVAPWSPLGDLSYACFGHTVFNVANDNLQPQFVDSIPNGSYGYWMSNNVYACFQLTFAIITPALIVGGIAERMKFSALVIFIGCWMFIVYFPLAHNVWGVDGAFNGVWNAGAVVKGMDFAGGTVVHMSSGWSGLTLALIVGRRIGWGKTHFSPHSTVLTFIGASLLWVGWYGFNAGSACAADIIAANAFTTTTLATATASFVWPTMEYFLKGKATVIGFCSGAVAGLVVITPACGYVTPAGGMIIGIIAGTIPYLTSVYMKPLLGYDDALDVYGVHGIGGMCGALATGFLADASVNPNLSGGAGGQKMADLCDWSKGHLLYIEQFKIVVFTALLSMIGTAIIAFALKFTIGLRPTPEGEEQGLDLSDHGEEGYIL